MTRPFDTGRDPPPPLRLYPEILREAKRRGLFAPRPAHYLFRSALNWIGIAVGLVLVEAAEDLWIQLVLAVPLALCSGQLALVGHDAGHRQITSSPRLRRALGQLHLNLAVGLSFGWWVKRHTRHHAYPNDPGRDPDAMNAFIVRSGDRRGGWDRLRRFAGRYQAQLLVPALFVLPAVVLHVTHVVQLVRHRLPYWIWELLLICGHFTILWWAVAAVLPPARAIAFLAIHRVFLGAYLTAVIAPNHKGMPAVTGPMGDDFFLRQVLTSRNVRGGRLVEVVFGGLNYQIEHHLFPSMPTPGLRRARPLVREYCLRHGVPYAEVGFVESYRRVLAYLSVVGRLGRDPRPASLR